MSYLSDLQAEAATGPQVALKRHEVLVNGVSLRHGPGHIEGAEAEATIDAYSPGPGREVEIRNYVADYPACSCRRPTPSDVGPTCKRCDRLTPEAAERFAL